MRNNLFRKILFGLSNKLNPRMPLDAANTFLKKRLADDQPLMVARFGAVEIKSLIYSILPPPDKSRPKTLCIPMYA